MIVALVLALVAGDVQTAKYRAVGVHSVELRVGRHTTSFSTGINGGNTGTLVLPFTTDELSRSIPPEVLSLDPPDAEFEFLGWDPFEDRWSTIPPQLRARTRPPLELPKEESQIGLLMITIATGVLVVGMKRSPYLAFAAGLAGTVVLLLTGFPEERRQDRREVRVLDGTSEGDWLSVVGMRHGFSQLGLSLPLQIETVSPVASIHWWRGDQGWNASCPGNPIYVAQDFDPGHRRFERDLNSWCELAEVWVREPGGAWTGHGEWKIGEPLPADIGQRGRMAPGWLASGLPQGTGILLGRLAPGCFQGTGPDTTWVQSRGEQTTWIRLTGF